MTKPNISFLNVTYKAIDKEIDNKEQAFLCKLAFDNAYDKIRLLSVKAGHCWLCAFRDLYRKEYEPYLPYKEVNVYSLHPPVKIDVLRCI
ncbi:hypothetical protein [Lactobacillus hominis]|uniref:hypothetical protein n=1 Tax=Lactobacillus hominis TaxID=1203033 RepID=UPI000B1B1209|nr:hypothetical protein [Lactobacillus hominis]